MEQITTTFSHNGVSYYFDIEDLECAEKFKTAATKLQSKSKDMKEDDLVENLKLYCAGVLTFFDDIFGEGAGVAICGEKMNSRTYTEAYIAFLDFTEKQGEIGREIKLNIKDRYMNRAQRRALARANAKADK